MTCDACAGLTHAVAHRSRVARLALQADVGAGQIEIGLRIVIETPIGPSHRAVTGCAIWPKPPFMAVIVAVTLGAFGRRVLEARRGVARSAGDPDMLADQRKYRQSMVEADRDLPAAVVVALLALGSLLACVGVISAVTGYAGHRQPHLARGLGVALRTAQARVAATQGKAGLTRVIKAGLAPIGLGMAFLAIGTVAAAVAVIGAMAGNALHWKPHLARRLHVACGAGDAAMLAAQRKAGACVIELLRRPAGGRMAFAAIFSQTAAMVIILAVAADAGARRAVVAFVGVAGDAARAHVRPGQRELRIAVIEADLGPVLIGMARGAAHAEAAPVRLVGAVALHARARRLAIFAPGCVTLRARHPRMGAA